MYEFKRGSARLVGALERLNGDSERLSALASVLYYCEEQLAQDIQALVDYYEAAESKEEDR